MSGIEAERFGDRLASALIVPPRTCGSASRALHDQEIDLAGRSGRSSPGPRRDRECSCTFVPVAFSIRMPVTCAAAFWLTNLASPGLAFIQATSSFRSLAGRFFLRDHELRIDRDQPDRLEVLLQIVVQMCR